MEKIKTIDTDILYDVRFYMILFCGMMLIILNP